MTVLLNITTVPQDFAAGTYDTAATAINSGRWRVVITPTNGSASYFGGNFHAILGQLNGGLWFNDKNLELYTNPDDNLAFSVALTWSPGQPITLNVDARVGHMTATITGATTGNGTVGLAFPGPYIDPTLLLEIGRQGGGTLFQFVGGISSIDDGSSSVSNDTVTPANIAVVGGTIGDKQSFKVSVTSANIAISSGTVSVRRATIDAVSAATLSIAGTGEPVADRVSRVGNVSPAQIALLGESIADRVSRVGDVSPALIVLSGESIAGRVSRVGRVTPATLVLEGGIVPVRRAIRGAATPASVSIAGGNVQGQVVVTGHPVPIPPGRTVEKLEGHVVTLSIVSRASEDQHLFGVIRRKKDV